MLIVLLTNQKDYKLGFDEKGFYFDLLYTDASISTQIPSPDQPSLVFGASGGNLSGFLAGVVGIGGAVRSLFLSPEYCPGFSVTNRQNSGTIIAGACTIEKPVRLENK